jgi:hypothetical protein
MVPMCYYLHHVPNIVLHWYAEASSSDQGGLLRDFFNRHVALRFGEQVVGGVEGNPLQAWPA